jgi:glycosyltransferase involved in cell wall biosynthesis
MVILHFVDTLERGGLERVVFDLSLAQRKAGHQVYICCLFTRGALANEIEDAGIPVYCLHKKDGPDLRAVLGLAGLIRRLKTDIVHSHNQVPIYYAAVARLLCFRSIRLVATRHNMGSNDPSDRREGRFKVSIKITDRVAFVSQAALDRFVQVGAVPADKSDVVLNCIPLDRYHVADAQSSRRAKALIGLPTSSILVGAVGRLVPVKNHRGLVEAIAPLFDEMKSLHLIIIGTGPLHAALETQARALGVSDRVHLLGERSDVQDVLPAFDVFAMPSESEGHSIALLEAMASGLAVVATAVGGNPEIVTDGSTGLLVKYGDCEALRQCLRQLLIDTAQRERLQQAARRWAAKEISLQTMVSRYDDFYRRAMSR